MLTTDRHDFIRRQLAAEGRVLAAHIAARFHVSEDTARRDLRELSKSGECRRVYGGATAPAPDHGAITDRIAKPNPEKAKLATAAARLIKPGQALFIDSGSTNIAIAKAIPAGMPLTVATNSLGVANALSAHPAIKLILMGGTYDAFLGACLGEETLRAIALLRADLFFIGSCGVDAAQGLTACTSAEAEVKRAMVKNSRALVVAATADKLGTTAAFRVAEAAAITNLVVAKGLPHKSIRPFRQANTRIFTA